MPSVQSGMTHLLLNYSMTVRLSPMRIFRCVWQRSLNLLSKRIVRLPGSLTASVLLTTQENVEDEWLRSVLQVIGANTRKVVRYEEGMNLIPEMPPSKRALMVGVFATTLVRQLRSIEVWKLTNPRSGQESTLYGLAPKLGMIPVIILR